MDKSQKFSIPLYAALTVVLYGGIFSGMVLGFFKVYYPPLVIIVSLLSAVLAFWLYRKTNHGFFKTIFADSRDEKNNRLLTVALYASGTLLFALLILLPVIRWPASIVTEWFPFDAAKYHFPKAIEMYRTASAWDFSLAYAQYSYGYESLLGLGLSITHNEMLFGLLHAVIAVFLLLTIWFLARRYTRISPALLYFLSVFILLSELLPIPYNIWWVLRMMSQTIGKNDLLVGAAMLSAVLYAPVGPRRNQQHQHLIGLSLSSMIAISVKPNALIVVAPLWLLAFYQIFKDQPDSGMARLYRSLKEFIVPVCLIIPGGLWAIRNLISQHGVLFTEPIKNIQGWSIANSFTNPYFYNYIPKHLIIVTLLLVISILLSLFIKKPSRSMSLAFLLLFLSFITSPVSAFFLNTDVPANIAWRFAVGVLLYCFLMLLVYVEVLVGKIYTWIIVHKAPSTLLSMIAILFSVWMVWQNRSFLQYMPANAYIIRDTYQESVGADGYNSVYDYIRQNIHDAVIWEEGGLPYYLFGEGFTNSITRDRTADYEVVFRLIYDDGVTGEFPDYLEGDEWHSLWSLEYEDSLSRLYKRK